MAASSGVIRRHPCHRRQSHSWSQGDLAARLGVSRQTINAIETGRYHPSLPLAFDIARLFACRIEDVFQPDGTRPPEPAA